MENDANQVESLADGYTFSETEEAAIDVETEAKEEAEPESSPEKPFAEEPEWKRNKILTKQLRDAERRLAQMEAEKSTKKAVDEKPLEMPAMPSDDLKYDNPEEYHKQFQEFQKSLVEYTTAQAERNYEARQKQRQQEQEQQKFQQRQQEIVENYVDNALQNGITEEQLQYNEKVLQAFSVSNDLAEFLYSDDNGPKIVNHLVSNPETLQKLSAMTPMQAAVFIASEVKPQALSTKPKTTSAPDPVPINDSNAPISDEWDSVGAGYSFE